MTDAEARQLLDDMRGVALFHLKGRQNRMGMQLDDVVQGAILYRLEHPNVKLLKWAVLNAIATEANQLTTINHAVKGRTPKAKRLLPVSIEELGEGLHAAAL